jgi:glutamate racemase
VGIFDSGVGGLTVLRSCLSALSAEDFVYFGDTDRFPYGDRSDDDLRDRARAVGAWLTDQGAKIIVVACNTASAAALGTLQTEMSLPVIGVMAPEARAAVQSTRNRRIGLMATEATVRSGSYERLILDIDAGVDVTSVACPALAPAIQRAEPYDDEIVRLVEEYTAPLREGGVDTVILGCTHYPLVEHLLRRMLPGVTLISSGEEIAREVTENLTRRELERSDRLGEYRFACSGDAGAFRSFGAMFLQMPLGRIDEVDPSRLLAR